jgi:hypothetical protein
MNTPDQPEPEVNNPPPKSGRIKRAFNWFMAVSIALFFLAAYFLMPGGNLRLTDPEAKSPIIRPSTTSQTSSAVVSSPPMDTMPGAIKIAESKEANNISELKKAVADLKRELDAKQPSEEKSEEDLTLSSKGDDDTKDAEIYSQVSALEGKLEQLAEDKTYSKKFTLLNNLWIIQYLISNSSPFRYELMELRKLAKDNPEIISQINLLEPFSGTGIKSFEELSASFPEVKSRCIAIYEGKSAMELTGDESEKAGFFDKALDSVSRIVVLRKVSRDGEHSMEPPAVLKRVEANLADGDLTLAIEEMKNLDSRFDKITEDWLKQAEARNSANDAIRIIYESISAE